MTLLLTVWLWSAPTCGEMPVAYRVESQRIYRIASVPGMDDEGNLISMPLYNVWAPTFNKEDSELRAEDGCEPAAGECCVVIVSSVDAAGNVDRGEDCP